MALSTFFLSAFVPNDERIVNQIEGRSGAFQLQHEATSINSSSRVPRNNRGFGARVRIRELVRKRSAHAPRTGSSAAEVSQD